MGKVRSDRKPNILVIFGDDIGIWNLSCYSGGMMGYRTPHIDRIAAEGMRFTDAYGEQSCGAGGVRPRAERAAVGVEQGRDARLADGDPIGGSHGRGAAQAVGVCNGPVRQESLR